MATTPSPASALEQTYNANRLAFTIASFVLGGGIIAAVLAFTIVPMSELLNYAIVVLLPIFALCVGVGLISKSTWDMLRAATHDSNFGQRVKRWVDELEKNPNARPSMDNTMYA